MARYGKDQKQATRQRILDTAGRRFKQTGIDGSGVATLMSDAGLTNGAFYAHFSSKDDLVAATLGEQLSRQCEEFGTMAQQPGGVEAIVRLYLSTDHRDHPEEGCPSAALLDEIGRGTASTKQAYTEGLLSVIDAIAAAVAPRNPRSARATVLEAFAMMAGALQISRAIDDPVIADEILENVTTKVLAMLGVASSWFGLLSLGVDVHGPSSSEATATFNMASWATGSAGAPTAEFLRAAGRRVRKMVHSIDGRSRHRDFFLRTYAHVLETDDHEAA